MSLQAQNRTQIIILQHYGHARKNIASISSQTPAPIIVQQESSRKLWRNTPLGVSEFYGALISTCNAACPIHYDQSKPNIVSSHYLRFRNFQERMEKHILSEYTLPKYNDGEIMSHVSSRNITCSHYHIPRKFHGKLQETFLSQPFFPAIMRRYACQVRRSYPRGDSSYHTRPRPAYRELPRASAG